MAMAGWAGFTDEDLKKLKVQTNIAGDGLGTAARRQANLGKPKPGQPRKGIPLQNKGRPAIPDHGVISPEQKLAQPLPPSQKHHQEGNNNEDARAKEPMNNSSRGNRQNQEMVGNQADKNGNVRVKSGNEVEKDKVEKEIFSMELSRTQVMSNELNKLEQYQQQQKMMEELNKQRKDLLSKTIAERSKKAKAESSKLNHIQKELSHLDHLLTADVSLIRDRIEESSISFMEAQKRYNKAEKEFVEAKMHLFKTAEQKDQLTDHLYTIIHKNELRKAQKLADLMKQLEMEISSEEMDITLPDLPPLTSFNSVQTLSPTRAPQSMSYPVSSPPQPGAGSHGNVETDTALTNQPVSQTNLPPSVSHDDTGHSETQVESKSNSPKTLPHVVSKPVSQVDSPSVVSPVKDADISSNTNNKSQTETRDAIENKDSIDSANVANSADVGANTILPGAKEDKNGTVIGIPSS